MNKIELVKEENIFFKDWIKKEWANHNETDLFYQLDLNAEVIFSQEEFYYKIMLNKEMVGFVGLILKDDKLFDSHTLYLYPLYIDSEYRNLGIGTAVIKELIKMAREMKRDIELECTGNNPAIHLYERMGFKVNYKNMILKLDKK